MDVEDDDGAKEDIVEACMRSSKNCARCGMARVNRVETWRPFDQLLALAHPRKIQRQRTAKSSWRCELDVVEVVVEESAVLLASADVSESSVRFGWSE